MAKIVIINGSYRKGGISAQMIHIVNETLLEYGHSVEIIDLKTYHIEYCLNCRECSQEKGEAPATCVIEDDMRSIISKIEAADGYLFISPTNFYTVTALYKKFLERLIVYGYWPWQEPAPKNRKALKNKKAIIISSCAAPSLLGRFAFDSLKLLRATATTVGAKVVGTLMIGLISQKEGDVIEEGDKKRIIQLANRLHRSLL